MNKRFWLVIAALGAVFLGAVIFNNKKESNTPPAQPTNHIRGNTASPVTFVEYGDFECGYCAEYEPLVSAAYEKYKDKVSFQFRHYPISAHRYSMAAARAAEAAGEQGKFWEMHDLIYRGQQDWVQSNNASKVFETYASQLNLDLTKYKTAVADSNTNSRIQADIAAFNALKLSKETPTFIINGQKVDVKNLQSLDDFTKQLDAAIKAKETPAASSKQ